MGGGILAHPVRPRLGDAGEGAREVRRPPQRREVAIDRPVHVLPAQAADGDHVGGAIGLDLQAQKAGLGEGEAVRRLEPVDAIDEGLKPGARFGRHGGDRRIGGAAEIENAQRVVDVVEAGAAQLRQTPAHHMAGERQFAAPQVRLNHAQREGGVVIGRGDHVGNLVRVPQDLDRRIDRRVERRRHAAERREAALQPGIGRQQGLASGREQRERGEDEGAQQNGGACHRRALPATRPLRRR